MDLYVEDLQGNQYFALGAVEEKARVNGEKEITVFLIENKVNSKFIKKLDHRWIIGYEGEEYVVLFPRIRTKGSKKIVEAPAIHKFFVDMRDSQQYNVQNGSKTFSERMQFIFNGTGYLYNTVDNFYAQEMENFGDADRLELFQQALNQYEAEFEIVNNIIYLKNRIGIDSNAFYEHKVNLTDIQIDIDGTSFATYGRGYGKDGLMVEYTSPLAPLYQDKYGLIEFPAIRDEKYTKQDSLYQRVKREVDQSLKVAITINGTKLKVTDPGDRIFLKDSRVDLDLEVRVVEVVKKRDINGKLIDHSVTLSNDGILKSYQSRMQTAAKQIQNLLDGRGRIPYNVLPATVKAYSEALARAQTEILFDNGLLAISKLDPNDIVLFNSAGLGISVDGGQTFKTAITAQGIVADVITSGQLNANNVDVININVENLVGNKATFVKDGWNGINSHVSIDANRILVVGNDGNTAKITNLGEFRSDSSTGRYVLMGNGRLQAYNNDGSSLFSFGAELISGVHGALGVTHAQAFSIGRYDDFFLTGNPDYHPYMTLEYETAYDENTGFVRFNKPVRFAGDVYMGENNITGLYGTHYISGSYATAVGTEGQFKVNAGSRLRLTVRDNDIMSFDTTYGYMYRNLSMEGNSITNQSDLRLKKNIGDTTIDALSSISSWNFVDYEWIDDNHKPKGVQFGLIAQDTPELMVYDKNRDVYSIDSSKQIMLNSYAIQQLHNKVLDLENRMSQSGVSE